MAIPWAEEPGRLPSTGRKGLDMTEHNAYFLSHPFLLTGWGLGIVSICIELLVF